MTNVKKYLALGITFLYIFGGERADITACYTSCLQLDKTPHIKCPKSQCDVIIIIFLSEIAAEVLT